MSVTAIGSNIVSFMISESSELLVHTIDELTNIQNNLTEKCQRLRILQDQSTQGYIVSILSDDEEMKHCIELYNKLDELEAQLIQLGHVFSDESANIQTVEYTGSDDSEDEVISDGIQANSEDVMSLNSGHEASNDILTKPRWRVCGFNTEHPMRDFENNGLLGIISLNGFLSKYVKLKRFLIISYVISCRHKDVGTSLALAMLTPPSINDIIDSTAFINLAQLSSVIAKLSVQTLHVIPHPDSSDRPLVSMAKHSHTWTLLSNGIGFQSVFDLLFLIFEENWKFYSEMLLKNWIDDISKG